MVSELVDWFEKHQRELPWRTAYHPYHVWVSEAMLQQTQVETALPYFERFIAVFPALADLAKAQEPEVLKLWAGLGYYSRARNLLAAARLVVERHGGVLPANYDDLLALPGIGRYMAGAIMSIAFNQPFPVVDGNVRRVLSRLNGWKDDDSNALWQAAAAIARAGEPRLVNQALMELGSTVCSFRAPRCLVCPVQASCVAFKTGMQDAIPPLKKRQATVHVHLFAVVQRRVGTYLMKPADGMWEFPTFPDLPPGDLRKTGSCRHTITHHRLDVSVYVGKLKSPKGLKWKAISAVAISSLTRKILKASQTPADNGDLL